jgi:hypothetical protein
MAALTLSVTDTPVPKDVAIAIAGAAAALGGLILVFLGVVVTSYQTYAGDTDADVLTPFRRAAAAILFVFALGLASATLSVAWLAIGGTGTGFLYHAALWTFFGTLLAVVILAIGVVYLVFLD